MKKSLIALAVAGAFVAPVAMADVTIYGIADVSYDNVKSGDGPASAPVSGVTDNKISSNSSRLGFKGNEDLGGGLKAIWQIETLVQLDNTGSAGAGLGTRNTFAGLAGDSWGSLTLGRNDTPYKSATRGMDAFYDHIADNRSLMGRGSSGNSFDARYTDTARYDSPNMNGFQVSAAYAAGSEANTVSTYDVKARVESLAGTYATGPFSAALAYQKNVFGSYQNIWNGTTAFPSLGVAGCTTTSICDEKAWKIGAGYKADQFAVNAVYEKTTDNQGSNNNGAGTYYGGGHKAYYLSGIFNATANDAIKLAYAKAKDIGDGNKANSGANQWSLGVDHSLSKRTTMYAMYTKLNNDSAAAYALSSATIGSGTTPANGAGADPSAFSIGMKHAF